MDLVHVPTFAEQFAQPGSRFPLIFSVGERADAVARDLSQDQLVRFWAARWAAREALIKAWSGALFGLEPPLDDEVLSQIEVATDVWGRPRLLLRDDVALALEGLSTHLSLSHDADYATAYVVLEDPR